MVNTAQAAATTADNTLTRQRVVAVSYLNTKPLLYGLLRSELQPELDLELAIPSECARRLVAGEADIALVPVAVIPELPEAHIISDYCIGCNGPVATVCLYGEVPIEEMTAIYLDHHSRTSVMLTRLLMQEYWQKDVEFLEAEPGYIDRIGGTVGGLVIGDRTIGLDQRFTHTYDLGAAWKDHTGLPFVFAAWVAVKPVSPAFVARFNQALKQGLDHLPELQMLLSSPHPDFSLTEYFTHYIEYQFDAGKKAALARFLTFVRGQDKKSTGTVAERL